MFQTNIAILRYVLFAETLANVVEQKVIHGEATAQEKNKGFLKQQKALLDNQKSMH